MSKASCRLCGETFDNQPDRCPMCGGSQLDEVLGDPEADAPIPRVGFTKSVDLTSSSTEDLEAELRQRSMAIERHQRLFQNVRSELKRRRETRDEQPAPRTADEVRRDSDSAGANLTQALSLKVTAMEAEQAKLVIEAQQARAAQREAEERLALVVKHIPTAEQPTTTPHLEEMRRMLEKHAEPTKREPLTREAAEELIRRHLTARGEDPPVDHTSWLVDAVVDASR